MYRSVTYINVSSLKPCLSARALDVLIFLLFIFCTHLLLQFLFPDILFIKLSMIGTEPISDSVSVTEAVSSPK